jgi:hypothetical protein
MFTSPIPTKGLVFWLRSDMGITLNGGTVSEWKAINDSSISFTQATASSQPTYNTNQINGHPALSFDGGDFMDSGAISALDTDLHTWFIVGKLNNTTGIQNFLAFNFTSGAGANSFLMPGMQLGSSNLRFFGRNSGGTAIFSSSSANTNYNYMCGVWRANNNIAFFLNAVEASGSSGATATPTGHNFCRIGASSLVTPPNNFLNGNMVDVICYNQELTAPEISRANNYLKYRYGL